MCACFCVPAYTLYEHCKIEVLRWDGLVVSVSASNAVGHRFEPRPGHTKGHHKNGTNFLSAWHACVTVDLLKDRVVCETVYGDMHLKDLLESISRLFRYRISIYSYMAFDAKKHYDGIINKSINHPMI